MDVVVVDVASDVPLVVRAALAPADVAALFSLASSCRRCSSCFSTMMSPIVALLVLGLMPACDIGPACAMLEDAKGVVGADIDAAACMLETGPMLLIGVRICDIVSTKGPTLDASDAAAYCGSIMPAGPLVVWNCICWPCCCWPGDAHNACEPVCELEGNIYPKKC